MKQYYLRKTKNKLLEIVLLCLYYIYIIFLLYFSLKKELFFGKLQKGIWMYRKLL